MNATYFFFVAFLFDAFAARFAFGFTRSGNFFLPVSRFHSSNV